MKTGIIDVGGGMRGIYAAGVFDYCLDHSIRFDYGIGISAGSANLASFMAGQRGRNFTFFHEYSAQSRYMGKREFLLHRSFINLNYIYGTLSNSDGAYPLNYAQLMQNPMEWYIVATNARTGRPHYFDRNDIAQDDYHVLMASSAIPVVCRPQFISGVPYYDGALGDTIPVQKAFADGCDKVVLILTKPENVIRTPDSDQKLARFIRRKYPQAARQLELRAEHYNAGVALAKEYARDGKVIIISPDDTCGVDTLTRDPAALKRLYEKGYRDGAAISTFLNPDDDRQDA